MQFHLHVEHLQQVGLAGATQGTEWHPLLIIPFHCEFLKTQTTCEIALGNKAHGGLALTSASCDVSVWMG